MSTAEDGKAQLLYPTAIPDQTVDHRTAGPASPRGGGEQLAPCGSRTLRTVHDGDIARSKAVDEIDFGAVVTRGRDLDWRAQRGAGPADERAPSAERHDAGRHGLVTKTHRVANVGEDCTVSDGRKPIEIELGVRQRR